MGHKDKTYVIFDGDEDRWAYAFMKGWKKSENVDFDFDDAHDLKPLTDRASDEAYIKDRLRERLGQSGQVIVLVGPNTKNLYKFVRWEIDVALELGLAPIVVNLNNKRSMDSERCPPILRDEYAVHVSFNAAVIRYALDQFPREHADRGDETGPRYYTDEVYRKLGL